MACGNIKHCPSGIFKYLFDKFKENPVNKGLIDIVGNSYDDGFDKLLPNIINSNWNDDTWDSKNVGSSYFKIIFKKFAVKIRQYQIAVGNKKGNYIFTSWILKGTTENDQEIILDDVNNTKEITQSHPQALMTINSQFYVKSIHFILKGKPNNYNGITFRNIELFGDLKE